jgi:hypothetical protein
VCVLGYYSHDFAFVPALLCVCSSIHTLSCLLTLSIAQHFGIVYVDVCVGECIHVYRCNLLIG